MRFTIGMAVHEDYHGVFFTINALRLYQDVTDCELLVVDNSPGTESGKHTFNAVRNCANGWGSVKYLPLPSVVGTSAPRQMVFDAAAGTYVMCMDCHVLLVPGALDCWKQWCNAHPNSQDLITGPLVFDNFAETATHYSPRWREGMEGTWGLAWHCSCGHTYIDVADEPGNPNTLFRRLGSEAPFKTSYHGNCGCEVGPCEWVGHQHALIGQGWKPAGMDASEPDFEIPGQGLGLFACRKDAWLGFNKDFRGFGGEELYIHRKYTQAGRRNLCVPGIKWYHRFAPATWTTYNREWYSRARNYVLGHLETKRDLDPVRKEFVEGKHISAADWAYLVNAPVANENPPKCDTCNSPGKALAVNHAEIPEEEHAAVVELVKQHARIGIYAKREWWRTIAVEGGAKEIQFHHSNSAIPELTECDLLIIHSKHHADNLYAELSAMAPKTTSRIYLRSTQTFGETAEGEPGPGLLPALRRYMDENPEWHVIEHSAKGWGYTVVSRHPDDKKPLPSKIKMAANFAKAIAEHVVDGLTKTEPEPLEARLNTCTLCTARNEDRCSACGCPIASKAALRSSSCPLGYWKAT